MTQELIIAAAGAAAGVAGLATSLSLYRKVRTQRHLLDFVEQQVGDIDDLMARNKEHLETNAQRLADQQRRIAWLETRVRNPRAAAAEEPVVEASAFVEPEKMSMTERRHRVVKLASRGQNVETIASTLGMLPGEVELIINLSQSAAAAGK